MLRVLLAASVFLPFSAVAGEVPSPVGTFTLQEPAALAAAGAYAADICDRAPDSCAEAEALDAAFRAALTAATACDQGQCSLADIKRRAAELAELEKRDRALILPAGGRPGRAFLALSVIATSRLTAAATRLGDPHAGSVYDADDLPPAKKAAAGYCLASPPTCENMGALVTEAASLGRKIDECAAAKCPLEAADPLVNQAQDAFSPYFALDELTKFDTIDIFVLLNGVNKRGIALYSPLADGAVAELVAGTDKLKKDLDRAQKNASISMDAVDSAGTALLQSHRRAAMASDRLLYFLGYEERQSGKNVSQLRRATVNAVAIKLSGLRARALALRTAHDLAEGKAGPGPVDASAPAPLPSREIAPIASTLSPFKPTLLDRRLVPAPTGPKAPAPPILPEHISFFRLVGRATSSDPVVRADALRRLKLTKTVGDPGRYAPHAFSQEGNDTCAVAVQVTVLRAHGLLPASVDPKVQERELSDEAKRLGYMKGGTAPEYSASLLIERGMLVDKHANAKWGEFESALRRGGLIQAGVDARKIWDMPGPNRLGHSILVTGAEVSKDGRDILGVYYNDTGTDPAGAGKFLPIGLFRDAWSGSFAEVR